MAHVPFGEQINYFLQNMKKDGHSSKKIAGKIIRRANAIQAINKFLPVEGRAVLEVGTGWEPISILLLYLMGAEICYSYDHLRHVRFKLALKVINEIENNLNEITDITSIPQSVIGNRLRKLKSSSGIDEMFERVNIVYKAPGDATKTYLDDKSIDIIFSYAVLEHVPESVLDGLIVESKRILNKNGIIYHAIGLHDHYIGIDKKISKINFLKYPEWLWSFFVKNKISYHNRLREKEFIDIFQSHGARIMWKNHKLDLSDIAVLRKMRINKRFHGMSEEELCINFSEIILNFPE